MFLNHLKIALRSLIRHKSYTVINVLGLSLGISCGLLIFLLVKFHLSFDTYHAKADRICRIVTELHFDEVGHTPGVPNPMANALKTDFPQLEKVAMIKSFDSELISVLGEGNSATKKFQEEDVISFAEPDFFKILDFTWLKGNPTTALSEPNTVVLTRKYATKYFGSANPIGKVIRLNNRADFKVTGILDDIAPNTHYRCQVYCSYPTLKTYLSDADGPGLDKWGGINSSTHCLLVLPVAYSKDQLTKLLPAFSTKYLQPEEAKSFRFWLQPLSDIHFNDDYNGTINKPLLLSLALVGLFLIVTACINFVNLATAKALKRSKEVGVRKVLGSTQTQLFRQFMTETGLITVLSVLLAIGVAQLALPYLNGWLKLDLRLQPFSDWQLLLFLPLLTLVVILLSGSYPALILSGFKPVMALKGKVSSQQIGGISLRRGLIILQFSISLLLIIGTIVVTSQTEYAKNADWGFNKEAIVTMPIPLPEVNKLQTLRNRMIGVPGVEKISMNYRAPASNSNNTSSFVFDTRTKEEVIQINTKPADDQYLETFGLKLVAGRNIIQSDTIREFLVNETFLKKLHLASPNEAIGKNLRLWGVTAPIVGVIKDFHLYSFRGEIPVTCVMSSAEAYSNCSVKINLAHASETIKALEKIWNNTYPDNVFEYKFLDEHIAEFYAMDEVMLKLIRSFSFIAIFISCLGLYGLVSFMAETRIKEIGIRKVLGATVSNIILLFSKEFAQLILIAFVIAAPIAWWVMNQWLQDFEYRIAMEPWIFVIAMGSTLLVAALTVGYQSIKAATANPVKSLRTE
ncbi:MAG: ABC transporter permease [Bacteroidota bacterium]